MLFKLPTILSKLPFSQYLAVFSAVLPKLVKKVGKQGELIAKHNHPEALVVFTCVKGEVKVYLNDDEVHIVNPGKVLDFDGDNYINAEFLQDGEVFVTLIHK